MTDSERIIRLFTKAIVLYGFLHLFFKTDYWDKAKTSMKFLDEIGDNVITNFMWIILITLMILNRILP